ncbi:hypothetical protein SISSUDRAFT_1049260 [Sistotremastrum suecicum HHB10207 ss-3]|uniref:Uncharacterized protein n=1 Tax=Sistotremastrum suecicum HHB10207 ss-3 TaxID=1314776 RepID=A0A166BXM2_9AGAM|nr:hypothetical protein SISSUDRAFT_1049260 [Sistotremastrum suecicum HHB10207 ss-3]
MNSNILVLKTPSLDPDDAKSLRPARHAAFLGSADPVVSVGDPVPSNTPPPPPPPSCAESKSPR